MNKYQNGKIYILRGENEVYYGSTTETLEQRYKRHYGYAKDPMCPMTSIKLFHNYDNVTIELIEDFPCNSKQELEQREGWYIKHNECINKVVPGKTREEKLQDKKDDYNENKDHYNEKSKERYEKIKNTEEFKIASSNRRINYRNANRDLVNSKKKEKRKEQTIICECGSSIPKEGLSRHLKTNKHINYKNEVLI
jgi:hypothetical protein